MGFVDFLEKLLSKILPPQAVLLNHTFKDIVANRCVYFAAEIGIANLLEDGPQPIEKLAEESGMNVDALYRVMRTLTTLGIFKERENRYFETNKPGKFLRHNAADSMASFIRVFGQPWLFAVWNDFERTVKNGKDYYENNHEENLFDWLRKNPQAQKIFDEGMTGASTLSDFPIISAYDFSCFDTIVDVGGGHGFILGILLGVIPQLKAVLFDLPLTIETVIENKIFEKKGLGERVECIGGDFFESVPTGYSAYLLKFILRDWEDKKAARILANCRKAMRDDSVLIIVENIAKDKKNKKDFSKLLDIALMSATGGRVRTLKESIKLLEDSGFKLKRAVPTASIFTILEAVPA
jgi:hypothetical protein